MRLKILTKILAFGILLNSVPINSFAGILSDDTRYETFTDNNIVINDILEEDKTNIKIEGNTLVNVIGKGFEETDKYSFLHGNNLIDDNSFVRFTMDSSSDKRAFRKLEYTPLKPSTIYTLFVEIKENTIQGVSDNFHVLYPISNTSDSAFNDIWGISVPDATVGIHKKLVTTKSSFDGCTVGIRSYLRHLDGISGSLTYRLWMVEGDHMDEDIPYFEGIKSGFEDNLVTQEMVDNGEEKAENLDKYKVEVKTIGKNLLNINSNDYTYALHGLKIPKVTHTIENNELIVESIGNYTWGFVEFHNIKVPKNKELVFSHGANVIKGNVAIWIYDKYNNKLLETTEKNKKFVSPTDEISIRFYVQTTTNYSDAKIIYRPQLEYSSQATSYEPYKESINTLYLNPPLLKGDTIEYINGQATHVHRSGKIVFDGSDDEKWDLNSITPNQINTRSYYTSILNQYTLNSKEIPKIICDSFNVVSSHTYDYGNEGQMATQGTTARYSLMIRHTSNTVEEFKQWLSKNPVTVVYELEEPIYEPIKADLSVQLFEGTTHISNNSAIPVNIEITVDRVLNRAVEAIELVKINPTVANIALSRMWTNLAKESIKKDGFQNEINNITKIKDLQIEKKAVTANMDIYIKPENSLSMSLSTNKIIFEDYSSVSDLDMDNAVRITVNSSLPYNLNSYLETEIQNNDGSSKINKELLHIKEDSDNKYKQFLGINQKLTLKEDCEAGKNNIHDIDLRLKASSHDADIYKTVIKFEAEQK